MEVNEYEMIIKALIEKIRSLEGNNYMKDYEINKLKQEIETRPQNTQKDVEIR